MELPSTKNYRIIARSRKHRATDAVVAVRNEGIHTHEVLSTVASADCVALAETYVGKWLVIVLYARGTSVLPNRPFALGGILLEGDNVITHYELGIASDKEGLIPGVLSWRKAEDRSAEAYLPDLTRPDPTPATARTVALLAGFGITINAVQRKDHLDFASLRKTRVNPNEESVFIDGDTSIAAVARQGTILNL